MPTLNTNTSIQLLQRQAASLYQQVLTGATKQAFLELKHALSAPEAQGLNCLKAYGTWFKSLVITAKSWQDYLLAQVLRDDNPFTQQVQKTDLAALPPALLAAAKQDMLWLQSLYQCSSTQLSHWVQEVSGLPHAPVAWDVETSLHAPFLQAQENWPEAIADLAAYYWEHGGDASRVVRMALPRGIEGIFAEYRALRWQEGQLVGIPHPDKVQLSELVGYEDRKAALLKNIEFLWAGYPALHVLLYGSRGSGKYSLVKALLNKFGNLRPIEVAKYNLKNLPAIIEQLRDVPQKFIIFVDAWDTMQKKLSFSARFGLTLTFSPHNQNTYLEIVRHMATQAGISLPREDLEDRALGHPP